MTDTLYDTDCHGGPRHLGASAPETLGALDDLRLPQDRPSHASPS
jgi:hypothetical protein